MLCCAVPCVLSLAGLVAGGEREACYFTFTVSHLSSKILRAVLHWAACERHFLLYLCWVPGTVVAESGRT